MPHLAVLEEFAREPQAVELASRMCPGIDKGPRFESEEILKRRGVIDI